MSRKFGKVWDYPTRRKFRRVTAIADSQDIAKGSSYEIERKFRKDGEVWYKLKGYGKYPADKFAVTYSTLGEGKCDNCGTTRLTRRFIERYIELSRKHSESRVLEILSDEFNVHGFTVKRLAREAHVYEVIRSIVLDEINDGIFSESFNFVLPKFRKRKILTEKETTDIQFRKKTQEIMNTIQNALNRDPNLQRFEDNDLILYGDTISPELKNLDIIFSPKSDEAIPKFGHYKDNPEKSLINIPMLQGSRDAKGIKNQLAKDFGKYTLPVRHEIGHYLDAQRYKGNVKMTSADILQSKGKEAYFNTPEEFNQFYQIGIERMLNFANKHKENLKFNDKRKFFPPDFKKFMKGFDIPRVPKKRYKDLKTGQKEPEKPSKEMTGREKFLSLFFTEDFINNINPQTRARFAKRILDAYPKILDAIYTNEEKKELNIPVEKKLSPLQQYKMKKEKEFYCSEE